MRNKVLSYMRLHVEDHLDCGEVNCTGLAEAAAYEFDLFKGNDIPEWVFEMSFNVSEEYEASGL